MTHQTTRIGLPIVLPNVTRARDECVARLVGLLEDETGVSTVHVVDPRDAKADADFDADVRAGEAELCLHYDPDRLSLAQVESLARAAGARVTERFGHVVWPFREVGAEDEGRRLEQLISDVKGVTAVSVNFPGQVARIEFDRRVVEEPALRAAVINTGVTLVDPRMVPRAKAAAADKSWYERNREFVWSLTAGALLVIGWLTSRMPGTAWLPVAIYAVSYVFGARDNVVHTWKAIQKGRFRLNIDFLMVVAALGAASLGEWFEGGLLLFLFSLGHALEHYAMGRARNAIRALADLAPQTARVLRDGRDVEVSIDDVARGDVVVVRPAERIPVDGTVKEGRSGVNQAPITGESLPVSKQAGDEVFAGSVNGDGALVVTVTRAVGDRTLDRVIKLVAEAETQKAPTQQLTDRFQRWFVPTVVIGVIILIVLPPLLGFSGWAESFYRGMATLVAASPCALALGTPATVLSGIAQAARRGVLIKGGAHLETLGTIGVLALDKTGTITVGEPSVTDIEPTHSVSEDRLLSVAAAVERRSQHPLARAVVKAAELRGLDVPAAGELESITGRGVRAPVDGLPVAIGRALLFEANDIPVPAELKAITTRLESSGRSTMLVRQGDTWLGVIGIADRPRENVRQTMDELRRAGIRRIVMLTGDNPGVGNAIGKLVGVDEVRAGLMPEDKVTAIRELAAHAPVAMVGDGVNDAPALAHATVGIAMGGAGTAAALETADVALMSDDLSRLPFAIRLSRKARAVIKQNLALSLSVIALLLLATSTGTIGIGPAVVMHEGSTLVVIVNALRLLLFDDSR